jgi:hypothetical protein
VKKIASVIFHPVTIVNLTLVGTLGLIELVHTKAHLTIETDVHGHVHRALKKNPELATPACYKLGFSKR